MKADLKNLQDFFDSQRTQFFIPVYQREYAWTQKQINQLLDDYEDILTGKSKSHFIGNVIYRSSTSGGVIKNELIDGQQRITTMFLLFIATKNVICELPGDYKQELSIIEEFISNRAFKNEMKMRLKPNNVDRETFKEIYNNEKVNYSESSLFKNYKIILNRTKKWIFDFGIAKIFDLFVNVNIVYIEINDSDDVKVQKVFESINSTGLDLKNIDLIRNFLLMGLDEEKQENFYVNKWINFENTLANYLKFGLNEDDFLKMFLQVHRREFVSKSNIYTLFKEYAKEVDLNIYTIMDDLMKIISQWNEIYLEKDEECYNYDRVWQDEPKNNQMQSSLLILCKNAFDSGIIDQKGWEDIKQTISIYFMRRKIADFDTSSITRLFTGTILNSLSKVLNSKEMTLNEFIYKHLFVDRKNSEMRAPSDEEIRDVIKHKNFYKLQICKQVLLFLENFGVKTLIPISKFEIEHIAPQNPIENSLWLHWIGEDYQTKINYLGNVTLVTDSMNKELSNKEWIPIEKKQGKKELFQYNKHIRLNSDISSLDIFNYDSLLERQDNLVEEIIKIFTK
ncbi:hypothetical protein EELLY_v1c02860 [Entomoplasma ellychniae]|uniref:DUF262 domain-containing protein n=1 Tax=Entomoplasma ellychniae TaxID=2114 RepID=A0A8E2UAK2_9MOLU|nr:DUF262 domain-containing protein [Entomoplasma ellychniae]PPE04606.1 hypothetical protein EELLY_v1c02860 [Entomoplasma ellychniae]